MTLPSPAALLDDLEGLSHVTTERERSLFRALRGEVAGLDREGWRGVCELAQRTFSGPFLMARLEERGLADRLPDEVATKLARQRAWSAARQALVVQQTEELGEALAARGIEGMVLKGTQTTLLYDTPGARASGDIDLLVHEEDVEAGRQVLEALGYATRGEEAWEEDHDDHRHLAPFHRAGRLPVELHWTMGRRDEGLAASDEVWANAVPWGGPGPMKGMDPVDLLLYTCKHLGAHHGFGTSNGVAGLADIEVILTRYDLDPAEVARRAAAWDVRESVAMSLRMAEVVLGAAVPEAFFEALAVDGVDETLPSAVWVLMHVGTFGAIRDLELPSKAVVNPPHPNYRIWGPEGWVRRGLSYARHAGSPSLDDIRLERPGWGRRGYTVLWARLGWRNLGLVRLLDPRVRASVRARRSEHLRAVKQFLGTPR